MLLSLCLRIHFEMIGLWTPFHANLRLYSPHLPKPTLARNSHVHLLPKTGSVSIYKCLWTLCNQILQHRNILVYTGTYRYIYTHWYILAGGIYIHTVTYILVWSVETTQNIYMHDTPRRNAHTRTHCGLRKNRIYYSSTYNRGNTKANDK